MFVSIAYNKQVLPYKNISESPVIQAHSLEVDAVEFLKVVIANFFVLFHSHSNMATINFPNDVQKFAT